MGVLWGKAGLGIYGAASGYKYYYVEVNGPSYGKTENITSYGNTYAGCSWWSNADHEFDSEFLCERFYR